MADIFTGQRFPSVTITIMDSQNPPQPATVDGIPIWASSDDTVLTVDAAADGMSAVISSVAPGVGRVSVTADADLGAGTQSIVGVSEDVNVTLNPTHLASTITFSFGAAEDVPAGP
jgi:hypothetical protein